MGRLGSNTLDPNELAAVLVSGIALSVGVMVLYRRSPLIQLGAAMIAVFALVGVWLTVSRGGLIALAVAVVAAVLLAGRWRPMALTFACLFAFATYAYFTAVASPAARDRITSPTRGQTVIEEGRTTIWQVAWRAFEANPVEGVGAGNFQKPPSTICSGPEPWQGATRSSATSRRSSTTPISGWQPNWALSAFCYSH